MRVRERTEAEEDLGLVQSPDGIAMASTGTTVLCLSFLNTSSPIPSLPAIFLSMCVWHVYTSVLWCLIHAGGDYWMPHVLILDICLTASVLYVYVCIYVHLIGITKCIDAITCSFSWWGLERLCNIMFIAFYSLSLSLPSLSLSKRVLFESEILGFLFWQITSFTLKTTHHHLPMCLLCIYTSFCYSFPSSVV